MIDRLIYGHIFMFETDLSLRYRIIVPVVFRGVPLPDDPKTAVRQIYMRSKLPEVRRIFDNKIVSNWDSDKDNIVVEPAIRRHTSTPEYNVLMYSFMGERLGNTGQSKRLTKDVTFKDVPSLRTYISNHHNFNVNDRIYRAGLSYCPFVIRQSILDSGDFDAIRDAVKQSIEDRW